MAVPESLEKLLEDGVIDQILRRLMSGKEASVYLVERQGVSVAAKVYKARDRRTFKATSSYTEGRNQTRNTRDKRAMDRRTSYGKELMEESWRDMEYRALFDAHHAGMRVPKPILFYEDVLLMELVVDEAGAPASRLADFDLTGDEAGAVLKEIYRQVRLLLGTGRIHGDLSAFNILMAASGPTIIDLPQVVDAGGNNQARLILNRDLNNVVEHLARFDERLLRFLDCGDGLYHHYQRGTLDEATEPREVRRQATGPRRMRGEERDGRVGQARRGPGRPPQRGPQLHDARQAPAPRREVRVEVPALAPRSADAYESTAMRDARAAQARVAGDPIPARRDEGRFDRPPLNERGPSGRGQERGRGPNDRPQDRGQSGRGPNDRGPRGPNGRGPNGRGPNGPNDRVQNDRAQGAPNDRRPNDRGPHGGQQGGQHGAQHGGPNARNDRRPNDRAPGAPNRSHDRGPQNASAPRNQNEPRNGSQGGPRNGAQNGSQRGPKGPPDRARSAPIVISVRRRPEPIDEVPPEIAAPERGPRSR